MIEWILMEVCYINWWDMFVIWVGVNVNNGIWFVGGVFVVCGFVVVMNVLVILLVLFYVFLSLVGYMGYKIGLLMMSLLWVFFGEWGSYLLFLVNII